MATGSAHGIGFAIGRGPAEAGAAVVLNGRGERSVEYDHPTTGAALRVDGGVVDTIALLG